MKRYVEVQEQGGMKGRVLALVVLALIVYGLIAHPTEAAQIGRGLAAGLAALVEAIVEFLQGL